MTGFFASGFAVTALAAFGFSDAAGLAASVFFVVVTPLSAFFAASVATFDLAVVSGLAADLVFAAPFSGLAALFWAIAFLALSDLAGGVS